MGEAEWAVRVELGGGLPGLRHAWMDSSYSYPHYGRRPGETDRYLINPYGLLWEEITASSLIKVDAGGEIVHQGSTDCLINPAGFKIHSALHTSERAAEWVMRSVPEVNAVANLEGGLIRGLSVYSMDIGGISYHDFQHATSSSSDVCARMIEDLGPENKVLLLPNHGDGDSIHEAFYLTHQLVEACKVQIMTQKFAKRLLGWWTNKSWTRPTASSRTTIREMSSANWNGMP